MPFDSSGTYSKPTGSTAVTGEKAFASTHNVPVDDIAAALTQTLLRDGRAAMTGTLKMGGNQVTGLANGAADTDAATVAQVNAVVNGRVRFDAAQSLTGDQKTQAQANIGAQPSLGFTPVNKAGDTMTGNLAVGGSNPNIELNRSGVRAWQVSVSPDTYLLFWDQSFSQAVMMVNPDNPDIWLRGAGWLSDVYATPAQIATALEDVVSRVGTGDYAEHTLASSSWFHAPTGKFIEGMRTDGSNSILQVASRRIYQNVASLGGWQPASEV